MRWSDKSHKENMDPRVDRTKNMNPKSYTMTTMTFNLLQNIDMKWWESTTYPMHQALPPEISISHHHFIINYVSHYVNHQSQSLLIITTAAAITCPNHHQNTIISPWSSTSQPLSQLLYIQLPYHSAKVAQTSPQKRSSWKPLPATASSPAWRECVYKAAICFIYIYLHLSFECLECFG